MNRNYIYIVVNNNGISMTVIAETAEKAITYVELEGYTANETREIGVAYEGMATGVID